MNYKYNKYVRTLGIGIENVLYDYLFRINTNSMIGYEIRWYLWK